MDVTFKKPPCPFGRIVARIREERHLTQSQLAQLVGRDQRTVSSIERGEREPLLSTILLYAAALNVRGAFLVEEYQRELERVRVPAPEYCE